MAVDKINPVFGVRGHVTVWRVDEKTGLRTPVIAQHNQIQYTWGYIAAKQIGFKRQADRLDYHISAMYIEFANQANPAVPISPGTFGRDTDINYYNSLSQTSSSDFLRIPLSIEPALSVSPGYEANLPVNQSGNQLTFFVQTSGTVGVNGQPFSYLNNSKVFSAALVAAPVFSDRSKDVVFARTTFSAENQVTKEASSQIGITWDIAFE
jgi:hypothetical protein